MPAKRRRPRRKPSLPVLLGELAVASAETIAHRTMMAATGRCSPLEYHRMVAEKVLAMQQTAVAAMVPGVAAAALLAPWHKAARSNSRRLRRK